MRDAIVVIAWRRIDCPRFTSSNILHRRPCDCVVCFAITYRHRHLPYIVVCRAWYRTSTSITALSRMLLFAVSSCRHGFADTGRRTRAWLPYVSYTETQACSPSVPSSLNFANEVSQRSSSASYKSRSVQAILLQTNLNTIQRLIYGCCFCFVKSVRIFRSVYIIKHHRAPVV